MPAESLHNPNQKSAYDAIIVHGAGVVKTPEGYLPGHDGMWRTVAAVQTHEEQLTRKLVFSGGHTLGFNHPSEAQTSMDFIYTDHELWQPKQPNIPSDISLLEEISKTTIGNIRETRKIVDAFGWKNVGYLTSRYHLRYVRRLLGINGIIPHLLAAEDLMIRRNPDHEEMIAEYYRSSAMKKIMLTQTILTALLLVDPYARIPEKIASRTRT